MKFEGLPDDVIVAKAVAVLRSIFGDPNVPEVHVSFLCPFCHTLILSCVHSVILSFCHVSILSYSHSVMCPFCHTLILSCVHSVIRSFCHVSILLFCSPRRAT